MKNIFHIILFVLLPIGLSAQSTLFDQEKVNVVYITIPPDSLQVIMTDIYSDHYFKARFIYNYGSDSDTLQDVGFRLRGNTSRAAQKKSFKISFNEYASGRRYQGVKKINLNGQHNDPSLIREKLFYDTWNHTNMPERRTSFVKLYINDAFYGLYTNLEEYDKDWLERVFPDKNGNLYKCTYPADLVYLNDNQSTYKNIVSASTTGGRAYELKTNETDDDYSDLVQLIKTLNQPVSSKFVSEIQQILNVPETLKAFALDVASGNWDDYMYNKNNYYLYHSTTSGKFEFISYDTDNTFGVDWVNRDWATRSCTDWLNHGESRPLAVMLLAVPEFFTMYTKYLDTLARAVIFPDSIFPHIDFLKNLITPAALADTYRSLDYGYTVNDFYNSYTATIDGHTPYGIKPFLSKRQSTMTEQLKPYGINNLYVTKNTFRIFPNPVTEEFMLTRNNSIDEANIYIYNSTGKLMYSQVMNKNEQQVLILAEKLPAGLYMAMIIGNNTKSSLSFIKL